MPRIARLELSSIHPVFEIARQTDGRAILQKRMHAWEIEQPKSLDDKRKTNFLFPFIRILDYCMYIDTKIEKGISEYI